MYRGSGRPHGVVRLHLHLFLLLLVTGVKLSRRADVEEDEKGRWGARLPQGLKPEIALGETTRRGSALLRRVRGRWT